MSKKAPFDWYSIEGFRKIWFIYNTSTNIIIIH